MNDEFHLPPRLTNQTGEPRRVGVEVEFGGLDTAAAARLVQRVYGGTIEQDTHFVSYVRGARHGDWEVELDSQVLKDERWRRVLEKVHAPEKLKDVVEDVLVAVAHQWIPTEIASPPIPIADLHHTTALREALRTRHAEGTHASMLYVFGFQLNPELPALDGPTIARYLRAFLALYDWLSAVIEVDATRRLTSFVDPYPPEYRKLVLTGEYAPDVDTLIGDYLEHNPTRNRALDMLPLFAHLDRERVLKAAREPHQVKARPTFHYRLPNSLVDEPSWSFALEWNRWVEIERLAEDPRRLRKVTEAALEGPPEMDRDGWLAWGKLHGAETR